MAHIVILGGGIGGIVSAYEMKKLARPQDRITVISDSETFHFTPSNPWVAVNWRKPGAIKVPLGGVLARQKIDFIGVGATRLHPETNSIELRDGRKVDYDYLIIATGPRLAFHEVEGFGPQGHTHSICTVDHAVQAAAEWEKFVADPGPIVVGAAQGASCFGPAYEFAFIMDTDLRRRGIRDKVPMTFVTAEPYIGHLGLGGVGDSKGMLESEFRDHHIKWICNAKTTKVEPGKLHVLEVDEDGKEKRKHELPFKYGMMLPAFMGIEAVAGIEGLTNPRGFILIDKHQRNPKFQNVYSVGVCVAIPPVEATPVPTGVPKTGYMIESMATAATLNIRAAIDGQAPDAVPTWNAICLADMGDTGMAFVAIPEIPPRNVNWMKKGKWVHLSKVAFEKYFLRKVRKGLTEPVYERYVLKAMGLERLRA
ncbi:MAG: pyridine nucleotide-disulfide oxidoreductase [Candidatus Muproteobacteria bacterium RBG_16_65_34]|uniref:Sulfide-quinone reductase n=1 Tax=Candidatus Muproteobacteria bacterium RBG_16_65_34 TaxID=1817760 RepID=A0A1F6TPS4_9PROT|nr:MAG: pyridine nucleotide-disulfide oxidoreductase [Candidatus Muproteobacteria bacterium RBG_16_65_34]